MSFNSRGAANSPAVLPTSSLLLAFLSTPFAIASFNTSLLRSKRSDPSGVILRHSSIQTRHGTRVGLSSLSRSDHIATQASFSGSESTDVCPGDSLPLHSSSLKRHRWWQRVNLCYWPVHSPLAINHSPRDSDHIVDLEFSGHLVKPRRPPEGRQGFTKRPES